MPTPVDWTFPLGACQDVSIRDGIAIAEFGSVRLSIAAEEVELRVEDGLYSPAYGVTEPRRFVAASGRSEPGSHSTTFRLRVSGDAVAGGGGPV